MGNAAPASAKDEQPPPLPPPCDLECQKQKDLALLKKALDDSDPVKDPAGYQKARVAYMTLLNGAGWLSTEKNDIAQKDVQPILKEYRTKYESLKEEQSIFTKFANSLKKQEAGEEESNRFLNKQLEHEKDQAQILNRLNQFGASSFSWQPYIQWGIDILITIALLYVAYLAYTKFFVSYTSTIPPEEVTNGN
uniref:Uncharacterized protein n=1 Tax=viral metagenome TaxID=1070528 RepID=A0A6C0JZD1_9ZZZZ